MKKLLALVLAALMMMSLAACAAQDAAAVADATAAPEATAATEEAAAGAIDMSAVKFIQDGVLSVGMEIGYPPFEDLAEDGTTPIGYDVDFAKALGEKLGVAVTFVNTAWDGIFQGIGVNYDCVISAVTITDERKESMLFSEPYISNYQAVVVRKDSPLKINSFLDLNGLAIAVQKETTSDILMSDYVSTGSINSTISANEKVPTCFTQLENGEVDVVVVDSSVADGYLASNPDKFVKAFQDESEPQEFGVAVAKDNTALQAAINQAITQLTAEGYFEESVAYWFGK
ncbi:Membrane-bound lytic murein transglycosylase F [bioreactor metagenome]|uniref:Membrane-bound lytic murein transglycosylase F n=1 Tax=bioreactor metagenome TaxID=1076179 RepID=A0A644YM66_9ZZZZ|nr:transporter substrate-binding domain-containing protein [Christensenella sp.]